MMNKRRLLAFICYIKQDGEKDLSEVERMFWKFSDCELPHMNLNKSGVRLLAESEDLHELYSQYEIDEINEMSI